MCVFKFNLCLYPGVGLVRKSDGQELVRTRFCRLRLSHSHGRGYTYASRYGPKAPPKDLCIRQGTMSYDATLLSGIPGEMHRPA